MIDRWESEKEKLLRYMKIPPKKKMEWLMEMHLFMRKYYSSNKINPKKIVSFKP